jgi:pyruvate/2-oxoglutarate dehydrogenase complex dihydrolipoamide acyltransferase (E2) component
MAKKADKALKKLRKAVTKLEEQNERLTETLERTSEDQAEALREIRDLLEERLTDRDTAPSEPAREDHSPNGETEEGPEVTEAAQRRAKELGVDLSGVKGTGSGGRVLVKDVEAAADGSR